MRINLIILTILFSILNTLAQYSVGTDDGFSFSSTTENIYVSGSFGADGSYLSLKEAFDSINANPIQTGNNIEIAIMNSTTETSSAILTGNATSWASLTIYPTASGLSISGNLSTPLIDFDGADNVTIDGRVNVVGSTKDLSIINISNTSTKWNSTIRFINDACSNTVRYCTIKGSSTSSSSGIILFSTTKLTTGNDNNIIEYNDVTSSTDANRVLKAIYSLGTASKANTGIEIKNNNVYNVFHRSIASLGIGMSSYTELFTISGNSIYETSTFVASGSVVYYALIVTPDYTSCVITNNYIGGTQPNCGGTAWTKSNNGNNNFYGIFLRFLTIAGSNIQGNIIRNINWSNTGNASWYGIYLMDTNNGVNIGTTQANEIGSTTQNESIIFNAGTTDANFYGIYNNSSWGITVANNIIAGITTTNSAGGATNIYSIRNGGLSTIQNNIIGSSTNANSIFSTSTSSGAAQSVFGIYTTSEATITGNTITNLTNGTNSETPSIAGCINGITSTAGTANISNNTISYLSIANANNSTTHTGSVGGIVLSGTATANTLSGNKIHNLTNSFPTFAGQITGIYFSGNTGVNVCQKNFTHSISASGVSANAQIIGIKAVSGATTYSNNIVNIGDNSANTFYGIYETGSASQNANLYHNTLYIGGQPTTGTTNSYTLYSNAGSNSRNFRNNIFNNARTNNGASGKHYAAFYNYTLATGLTNNYNDYYTTGTGGVLAHYNSADVTTITGLQSAIGQDANSINFNPNFENAGGTGSSDYKPDYDELIGAPGTGITTDYIGTIRGSYPTMGAYENLTPLNLPVQVWKGGVKESVYGTLKYAFDAINSGTHTGDLEIKITQSIVETASAVLYDSGYNETSEYSSIHIFPTISGLSVSGNLAAPLIDLNGAHNVIIDGRVNAAGSAKDLTISNSNTSSTKSTGTSAIRFINDASLNTVKYCTVKGSTLESHLGIILFSTALASGLGNDNNVIEFNDITCFSDANRPQSAITSYGTINSENSENIIRNNNIYNVLNRGLTSFGIRIAAYNNAWTISGNSFYETETFIPTSNVSFYFISLLYGMTSVGENHTISGNFIGGQSANCGGSALTKTNAFNNEFYGVYLGVIGSTNATNIQGNTIANINWSNSGKADFSCYYAYVGTVNFGNVTGNIIGVPTTGPINYTAGATGANFYGLNIYQTVVDARNNTIESITISNANSDYATNFYGFYNSNAGATTYINNRIGSTTITNSINATSSSSANAQLVYGIYDPTAGWNVVTNNIISNLTNGTTNLTPETAGTINGINVAYGNVTYNTISHLTISNLNNSIYANASVAGIVASNGNNSINYNTINNLTNTNNSFSGQIFGIYFTGGYYYANTCQNNFIHSLTASGTTANASIFGIRAIIGTSTFSNNIVNIGDNTSNTFYGLYDTGAVSSTCNIYHNTIHIGGSPTSGSSNSYALYSYANSNYRNYRNNIFSNLRSNNGASGKHYAAYYNYAVASNLTNNNNDYYTPGNGAVLAYYNASDISTLTGLQSAIGQDSKSKNGNPMFVSAGGTSATDYIPDYKSLIGAPGTEITTDYSGDIRNTYPTMGAFDISLEFGVQVWKTDLMEATYMTLKDAFDAINAGTHKGALEIKITESTEETASAVLYQSGYNGTSEYSDIDIYPTTIGIIISGNLATPLINLNGADNVTIDGRVNAAGSAKDLTISNSNTSATEGTSTIRFINDATNNTLKYCTFKGASTFATSAVIFFSTTIGNSGNDNNLIETNNITGVDQTNRPLNAISSFGSATYTNNGITINNNNFYDFLNKGSTASNGIYLSTNTTDCTISNNSFYETSTFIPGGTAPYNAINLMNSGTGFIVSENYIGGSEPYCGGASWTKTNASSNKFNGIYVQLDGTNQCEIQGNTIRNFNWSNLSGGTFNGIFHYTGTSIIGTTKTNTIGSTETNGSIFFDSGNYEGNLSGIKTMTSGSLNCQNNIIAGLSTNNNGSVATNIFGINYNIISSTNSSVISNNIIGSSNVANKINAASSASGSSQYVYGIYVNGAGQLTISGNTIQNLSNAGTSTGGIVGIYSKDIISISKQQIISNNTISNLSSDDNNLNTDHLSSGGIIIYNSGSYAQIFSNEIRNISNTNTTFAGQISGIYFAGNTGVNTCYRNFIHNISVSGANASSIYGIKAVAGVTTYSNNIISLETNSISTIYGIFDAGAASQTISLFHNSVYLGGAPISGANNSYAIYSNEASNTRDYRNNIFSNARNNNGATGKHYAVFFNYATTANLSSDYNDYYAPNSGAVLARYNSTDLISLAELKSATGLETRSRNKNPLFSSAGGTNATDYLPGYNKLIGVTGTGITTDFAGNLRATIPTIGPFEIDLALNVEVWKSELLEDYYLNLNEAFDAINTGIHTGSLEIRIIESTVETSSAVLNASESGDADYSNISIYPTSGNLSVSGDLAAPLIDFNGAKNVILDGRVNALGSAKDLTVTNISTSQIAGTSTIRFINNAGSNIIRYCNIKGAETKNTSGVVFFSTANESTGNIDITIDNNNISSTENANRPINAVYSSGTLGKPNNNITISNNNIYDFLNGGYASQGVNFDSNTTGSSITGNSFYETSNFAPTSGVQFNIIRIVSNSGSNFTVTNNYIGGTTANCGGSPWVKTASANNTLQAISISVSTDSPSSIQGNSIQNFDWSNSASADWSGIFVYLGHVNIGTESGNIIGTPDTGTINISAGASGSNFYGLYFQNNTINCFNNVIESITLTNTAGYASNFYGIRNNGANNGEVVIQNNRIGNSVTANSIHLTSQSNDYNQLAYGIVSQGSAPVTISGNTIANITNATTSASNIGGLIQGIYSYNTGNTLIESNTIHNLTISNLNSYSNYTASVGGIILLNNYDRTVRRNAIYNLTNNNPNFSGHIYGIYFSGGSGTNECSTNYIHNLSVSSGSGIASIYGIRAVTGVATYVNNIISLGGNTTSLLYGIYDSGATSQTCNLYHNTVYIDGSPTTGSAGSYALYSNASNNTRNNRNNILFNARSNSGATGKHYAAFYNYATADNLINNYNNYYTSGSGGTLAYFNSSDILTLTSLKSALGQDDRSRFNNPLFSNEGGANATDYTPGYNKLLGLAIAGITTDYSGITRAAVPTMGAFEISLTAKVEVWKSGSFEEYYDTVKESFDAINAGTHKGILDVKILGSTTETATARLNANGSGGAEYNSINLYPVNSGLSISGNIAGPLIDFNGADYVTLDGRVNGEGTTKDLTIANTQTATTTATIRYYNDASYNTVKYCNVKGASISIGSLGIISFTTGTATGNIDNVIDNNNITGLSDANRHIMGVYSVGSSAAITNRNLTISNNNFYNLYHKGGNSWNVYLGNYTTACDVTGNSFYETAAFVPASNSKYTAINIPNSAGVNFTVSGNYIGGNAPLCTGNFSMNSTYSNSFYGIYLNPGTSTASNIQGNTITNMTWNSTGASTSYWVGIMVERGFANVGTTAGNTIGSSTGNGAIQINFGSNSEVYAYTLLAWGTGTLNCENNVAGSITMSNSNNANTVNFYGIKTGYGTNNVSNNLIGSTSTSSSIHSTSQGTGNAQQMFGINNTSTGTCNFSSNTIANISNGTTNTTAATAGFITGIYSGAGTTTISNNTIRNLTIANANTLSDHTASVSGISINASSTVHTISSNSIYDISNSYASFAGRIYGIYFNGPAAGANVIKGNYIYRLSNNVSASNARIAGLYVVRGNGTISNNILNLAVENTAYLFGISDYGTSGTVNYYNNTVYIGGNSAPSTSQQSYGFFGQYSARVKNIHNNNFVNSRSTTGGFSNTHFAFYLNYSYSASYLALDYNNYYVSGTGSTLAYVGSNKTAVPIISPYGLNDVNLNPGFASIGGSDAVDYKPANTGLIGTGTVGVVTDFAGTARTNYPTMGAFEIPIPLHVEAWKSGVFEAGYPNLKCAFDAVNTGSHTGDFDLKIIGNVVESLTARLNASGTGGADYNSIHIYPTVSGLSVSSDIYSPMIELNGADHVTFDGRVDGSGTDKNLIISNSNTLTSANVFKLLNDASENTIKYCTIKGADRVFWFYDGSTTGNDNNIIENNDLTGASAILRPRNVLYSFGTYLKENSGNIIRNNNFYNNLRSTSQTRVIEIAFYNSDWILSGNSFYETENINSDVNFNDLYLSITGSGHQITDNFFGGTAAQCGGSVFTYTRQAGSFTCINVSSLPGNAISIQNNIISKLNFNSSLKTSVTPVYIGGSGTVNFGTVTGNIIGATSGTGSIISADAQGTNYFRMLHLSESVNCNISNNTIAAVTHSVANPGTSTPYGTSLSHFYGVCSETTGTVNLTDNIIGSSVTANSIQATGNMYGIWLQSGTSYTLNNNIISNLSNSTSAVNTLVVDGINVQNNCLTAQGNTISGLSNASAGSSARVSGIFNIASGATSTISGNFINNLTAGTATPLYGINLTGGSTNVYNNIISLGNNSPNVIHGIYDNLNAGATSAIQFNTIYIQGQPESGSYNSSSLFSYNSSSTRVIRNNIFNNSRSNNGASGAHFGVYFNYATTTNLTSNYNNYLTNGTGSVLAYFNSGNRSTLAELQSVTNQDANSLNNSPVFFLPGGPSADDYRAKRQLRGVAGTGITLDFGNSTRNSIQMGAWNHYPNYWKGATNNDWNTAANWTSEFVPYSGDDIEFDSNPLNHAVLDQNRIIGNITNTQSTYRAVINGFKLSINGNLAFTNGAQIDASASGSTLEFTGSAVQVIPSGCLLNNEVYDLTINNSNHVFLASDIRLLHSLTTSSGKIDANWNTPNVIYAGSSAQTIEPNQFMDDMIYKLTIDNTMGVTLNTEVTVGSDMTINSGKSFTIAPAKQLRVLGVLTNNAGTTGLVINSTADGTGSLIHDTDNVPATVKRYFSGDASDWHFLSAPVSNQVIGGAWKPAGTYGDGTGYDLYVWDEANSCWIYNLNNTVTPTWPAVHASANFISGRGYLYAVQQTNPTKQFSGNLNNGIVNHNLTKTGTGDYAGFSLLGNPYPSSIDWKENDGFTRNMLYTNSGGYDIWIWNPDAGNYGVFNSADAGDTGTNDVSRYIAPMQGFFVRANAPGQFEMNNTSRSHTCAGSWKIPLINIEPEEMIIKVESLNGNGRDEVKLKFKNQLKEPGAMKLFSRVETAPSLYITDGGRHYSVISPGNDKFLNLSFKPGIEGDFNMTFKIDKYPGEILLLEDKKTGKIHDLKQKQNYTFAASVIETESRFRLHFGIIGENEVMKAKVYSSAGKLIIDLAELTGNFYIIISDVGAKILETDILEGGQRRETKLLARGIYFVHVKSLSNGEEESFKVLF